MYRNLYLLRVAYFLVEIFELESIAVLKHGFLLSARILKRLDVFFLSSGSSNSKKLISKNR